MPGESSTSTTLGVETDNTSLETTSITTARNCGLPKLRTSRCSEYIRCRKNVLWWYRLTKMPKTEQAPHITLNSILDDEVHDVATNMDHAIAEGTNGVAALLAILDEHFKPNTFIRKMSLWEEFRKCEKTPDMTWMEYVKK